MAGKFTGVAPGSTGLYFEQNGFHRVDGGSNKNLPSWSVLLPLVQVGFIVSTAEAAKSCFRGEFAAFDSGGFHRVFGRGSKILLPEVRLLPLVLASFIGSSAEAAKSCFRGAIAAFGPGELHRVFGRSSKILSPWSVLLPLALMGFIVSMAEAAKTCIPRHVCCLWSRWVSSCRRRRQLKTCSLRRYGCL